MQHNNDPLRQYAFRATEVPSQQTRRSPMNLERAKTFPGPTPPRQTNNPREDREEDGNFVLNYNAVFCFIAMIIAIVICGWLLLRGFMHISPATELSKLTEKVNNITIESAVNLQAPPEMLMFQNLASSQEKRSFLELELSVLLSKYNGSIHDIKASYNQLWTVANRSNLTEFSSLYDTLLEHYQKFFKLFDCAQSKSSILSSLF